MLAVAKVDANPGVKLIETPAPRISQGHDVLIEVGACGICGADLQIYKSTEYMMSLMSPYGWPRIVGHEIAGIVRQAGKDVTEFKEGDHVVFETAPPCGFCFYCSRGQPNLCEGKMGKALGVTRDGGFAKYVVASSRQLFKIPQSIPLEEAAVLEPLGVALHAVERSHLKAGDTVVIIGSGPLGILGAMLVQLSGIRTVIVAGRETSRERLKLAGQLGVRTIEISGNNLQAEVQALTAGRGADVFFDFAGGAEPFNQALKVVRPGGEIVTVGLGAAGEIDPHWITFNELTVLGSRARLPSTWGRAINLAANRAIDLRRVITHVFPLEEYEQAFRLLFDRKALKICLVL